MKTTNKFALKPLNCLISALLLGTTSYAMAADEQENATTKAETDIELIQVTGFRSSLNKSLATKRIEVNTTESIAAEDIGKFPDLNIAESLQRIPGVAISREGGEGRQITLRGLGPAFTRTTLNGMEMPASTDGTDSGGGVNGGRAFDFNIFASELFNRVDIQKTPTAATEEGGIAGTVDMYSARPFDSTGFHVAASAQAGYSDLTEEVDPRMVFMVSNTFADDTIGALFSVAKSERTVRQEGFGTVRWTTPVLDGGGIYADTANTEVIGTPNTGNCEFEGQSVDPVNCLYTLLTPEEAAALGGFALDPDNDVFAGEADGDISDLSNMEYDNLFMEDSVRTDEVTSIKLNLQKDFDFEYLNFIKIGGTYNEREHFRDKDRWSYAINPLDCGTDETCITVANSNVTDYNFAVPEGGLFTYPFVSNEDLEYMVDSTKITRDSATGGEVSIDSTKEDYTLYEDTYAAYIMAELQLSEQVSVITGVRYAHTEFSSTGYMSLSNDDWNFGGDHTLDISVPLPEASITYSEFFPSMHIRYEPNPEMLVRTSLWTSYTRPSFKQARGFARFDSDISLCDPTTNECYSTPDGQSAIDLQGYILGPDNALQVGNPNLVAMTSDNFDASFGWYPSKELFMEAAVFYKNIDNFIVDVTGIQMSIDELPLTLPVNQVSDFAIPQDLALNQVDITLNGDKATVYGVELSYNQFFENGLFWQSNMTFVKSEAELDATIRQDKMQLPGQADITGNVAVGWENETFSFRLINLNSG